MIGIPPFYNNKKIFEFVDEIIESYNIKSYQDVSLSDKIKICGVIINHETENECSDWLDAFVEKRIAKKFSECLIKKNTIIYLESIFYIEEKIVSHYSSLLEQLFEERISHAERIKNEYQETTY